jgi:hypothetical protein
MSAKQVINVSLERLGDQFRRDPSQTNAVRYQQVALEKWYEEYIDDQTLLYVLHEIRNS